MINQDDFERWMDGPTTRAVFELIKNRVDSINDHLLDEDILLSDDKTRARLLGQREALNLILGLSIDDLLEEIQHV